MMMLLSWILDLVGQISTDRPERLHRPTRPRLRRAPRRRPELQRSFVWPRPLLALLGKISDTRLARLAGVSRETVFFERQRRKTDASQPHLRYEWTAETISLLGTAGDAQVAAMLGITRGAVFRQRLLLGIPPHTPAPHQVPEYHWEAEDLALLGKMPDQQLAARLGISAGTVCRQRHRLKIPAYRFRSPDVAWTAEMLELLGILPDPEVARRLGIPVKTVKWKRRQLDLPCPVELGDRGSQHRAPAPAGSAELVGAAADRPRVGDHLQAPPQAGYRGAAAREALAAADRPARQGSR
jgi:hypothetical protein